MRCTRLMLIIALTVETAAVTLTAQRAPRTLTPGETVRSRLELDGPGVGMWHFDGAAGEMVSVTARSAFFEPTIHLVSPTGVVVARDDDGSVSRLDAHAARLVALLPTDGEYLVRLAIEGPVRDGAYEVALQLSTVTPLEMNGPAVVDEGDLRLWSFDGAAGEVVRVTAARGAYMAFDVVSPAGESLAMNDERLVVRLPLDGRYLVRRRVVIGPGPRRTAVAVSAVPAATETATLLTMGTPGSGVLNPNELAVGDWAVEGSEGEVIRIAVNGFADPVVQLLSPTGEEVAWGHSAERNVQVDARLPMTGRYLVRVLAHSDFFETWPESAVYAIEVGRVRMPAGGAEPREALAAQASEQAAALTLVQLLNAEYDSVWVPAGKAKLIDGAYYEPYEPGSTGGIDLRVNRHVAFGDLNGDSVADGAVILYVNRGGSGTFYALAIVVNEQGRPRHVASVGLGDRVRIQRVAIAHGRVVVEMLAHGPGDGLCCPTQQETRTFRLPATLWRGNSF